VIDHVIPCARVKVLMLNEESIYAMDNDSVKDFILINEAYESYCL